MHLEHGWVCFAIQLNVLRRQVMVRVEGLRTGRGTNFSGTEEPKEA